PVYRKRAANSRHPAFQAGCRGFEPRLPLSSLNRLFTGALQAASWQASGERVSKQAVLWLEVREEPWQEEVIWAPSLSPVTAEGPPAYPGRCSLSNPSGEIVVRQCSSHPPLSA